MASYTYQALSKEGKKISGVLDAPSLAAAREQLQARSLYPITVALQEKGEATSFSLGSLFATRFSLKDQIFFTRQLHVLLQAGIQLVEALNLLVEQSDARMRPTIIRLRDALKEGASLAQAMSAFPALFPPLYVQLVRAGEASGQLERILQRLADFLEKQEALRQVVSGAIRGPLIQLFMVFGIGGFLLTYVVPQIATAFLATGKELPLLTRVVLGISNFITGHYIILAGIVVGIFVAYNAWVRTASGRLMRDRLKLKLPIVKRFTRGNAVIQFSRTLGMLLAGNVQIAEALDIVVKIVDNQVLVNALSQARDNIIKQGRVAEYLQRTGLFSPVAIYLISTGEQSGSLDAMLTRVAEYSEDDLNEYASNLTALLNPLSMVMLAAVVGTIIFAVMQPIMQMSQMTTI